MRNALCALILALAVWPLIARADDYGPSRTIAGIRHDLPVLLAAGPYAAAQPLRFESVVVSGADALVECDACSSTALLRLHYRYDRWWLLGYVSASSDGLLTAGLTQPLVTLAHSHLAMAEKADAATPPPRCKTFNCYFVSGEIYDVTAPIQLPFNPTRSGRMRGDAYLATVTLSNNDGSASSKIASLESRAPTQAESWVTPGGNSYFFFSGTVQSSQPVHVQAGTTVDVWFPFVLDASLRYSLTIAGHGFTAIGPVDGTLDANTLHFVLPAFTVSPGVELMGEVESD